MNLNMIDVQHMSFFRTWMPLFGLWRIYRIYCSFFSRNLSLEFILVYLWHILFSLGSHQLFVRTYAHLGSVWSSVWPDFALFLFNVTTRSHQIWSHCLSVHLFLYIVQFTSLFRLPLMQCGQIRRPSSTSQSLEVRPNRATLPRSNPSSILLSTLSRS